MPDDACEATSSSKDWASIEIRTGSPGRLSASPPPDVWCGVGRSLVPARFEWMQYRGERYTIDVGGRELSITCELVPRRRIKVYLDGALVRETGALQRGLRLRLPGDGAVEVECQWYRFCLGDGLGVRVNGLPVEGTFLDPAVRLQKAFTPAAAYTALLGATTLFLLSIDGRYAPRLQRPLYVVACTVLGLCLAAWRHAPDLCLWATLCLGSVETFGSGSALLSTFEASRWLQSQHALGIVLVLLLFAARVFLLHLLLRCAP
eukprot:EG_transcript_17152